MNHNDASADKDGKTGNPAITPYLLVDGAARLPDFLAKAFDATELQRRLRPDGSIMHAEVRMGDSVVMMGEPVGQFRLMPASLYLYVSDCDSFYHRALQAGGISVMEPATMPAEGDRYGGVKDPCGNVWWIATHIEDVSKE